MQRYYYLIDEKEQRIDFNSFNFLQNTYDIKFKRKVVNCNKRNLNGKIISVKQNIIFVLHGKGAIEIDSNKKYIFFTNSFKELKNFNSKSLLNYYFDDKEPYDNEVINTIEGEGRYCISLNTCSINNFENSKQDWRLEISSENV